MKNLSEQLSLTLRHAWFTGRNVNWECVTRLAKFCVTCLAIQRVESMSAERQEELSLKDFEALSRRAEEDELQGTDKSLGYITLGPNHIVRYKCTEVTFPIAINNFISTLVPNFMPVYCLEVTNKDSGIISTIQARGWYAALEKSLRTEFTSMQNLRARISLKLLTFFCYL